MKTTTTFSDSSNHCEEIWVQRLANSPDDEPLYWYEGWGWCSDFATHFTSIETTLEEGAIWEQW
jgi:hypothetical protein